MLKLFFCLSIVLSRTKLVLQTEPSLFGPPLGHNGRSTRYNFMGDYSVTTYASDGHSYTQLGYDSLASEAILVSKKPTGSNNCRVDYKVTLRNSEITRKRNGIIAFFLVNESSLNEDEAFKVTSEFDGALVILDLKGDDNGKPYIGVVARKGIRYEERSRGADVLKKVYVDQSILQQDFVVSLEQDNDTLSVFLGTAKNMYPAEKSREHARVLTTKSQVLDKGSHIGISSLQKGGSFLVRLQGIRCYTIIPGTRPLYKVDHTVKKRSKLVWLILIIIACGIGYYLFKNYKRYK